MQIYSLAPRENWICDRFVNEWNAFNPEISTNNILESDIVWLLADWCWNQVHPSVLQSKIVVASVHHITPSKFGQKEKEEFSQRDRFVDLYHVPCELTKSQIESYTKKPIWVMPFWVNGDIWYKTRHSKKESREAMGIDQNCFLIGSFQRDTEGHDLITPKWEKGPDLFCDAVEKYYSEYQSQGVEVKVLLGGWRRQYVMSRLEKAGIEFYYSELPEQHIVNHMYNALDLYIVAARHEGGPQAIVECACTETPIISTDVGIASLVLSPSSIFSPGGEWDAKPDVEYAKNKVTNYLMPSGFVPYIETFNRLLG